MISKHDYGCEIMSFIVLFILSSLNHFWYIMILICIGAAVWGTGALLARMFLHVKAASFLGPRAEWLARMPAGRLECRMAFLPRIRHLLRLISKSQARIHAEKANDPFLRDTIPRNTFVGRYLRKSGISTRQNTLECGWPEK